MEKEHNGNIGAQMKEAEDYLDSTLCFAKKNSIEVLRKYLDRFGNPDRGMKIVHVAGTNGKGSVCSQIASCLREAGFSVGLFISPHLTVIRERMSIDGEMISEEEFLECFGRVKGECEKAVRDGSPHLLYFEMLFMMAMLWFTSKKPDYLVLETGMGGRRDATNAVSEKEMTVITRIGLDHTSYLGDTVEKIAREKAGILRKDCPAVFLTEPEEAFRAIKKTADDIGAPVCEVSPQMWTVNRADENGIDFSLDNRYDKNLQITLSDRALYQCENAALSVTAAGILFRKENRYDPDFLKRGIEKSVWPGRMEEVLPHVWIDGAHNPDGIRAFMESVRGITGVSGANDADGRRILLFSCVSDKDYSGEMKMIGSSGLFTDIVSVPMSGSRALDAQTLRRYVNEYSSGIRTHETESVKEAVERFVLHREEKDLVFAAGSLYLIGEMRGLITCNTD